MDSEDAIKQDYKEGLESIYAIQRLEGIGMLPKDAETLVEKWDSENSN